MNLHKPITTKAEAVRFVVDLHEADKLFHFEDDPAEIISTRTGEPLFSPADIEPLRERIAELFTLIDPFEIAITLTGE
jgi:hypothetical protein